MDDPRPQDELVMEPQPQPRPTRQARLEDRPRPADKPRPKPTTQKQSTGSAKQQSSRGQETGKLKGTGNSSFDSEFGDLGKSSGSTAEVKADIKVSIGSQVAPYWNRCRVSGLDIDKLRAVVSFRLDKSGKLAGWDQPRVTGQNAANSAQAGIFGECAVKALRQVGTFTGLPADRYDLWQRYEFEFTKR
jgi:periplasmic protein TonB